MLKFKQRKKKAFGIKKFPKRFGPRIFYRTVKKVWAESFLISTIVCPRLSLFSTSFLFVGYFYFFCENFATFFLKSLSNLCVSLCVAVGIKKPFLTWRSKSFIFPLCCLLFVCRLRVCVCLLCCMCPDVNCVCHFVSNWLQGQLLLCAAVLCARAVRIKNYKLLKDFQIAKKKNLSKKKSLEQQNLKEKTVVLCIILKKKMDTFHF